MGEVVSAQLLYGKNARLCRKKTTFACYSYFLSIRSGENWECLHVQMKKLAGHQTSFSRIVTHFFTTPLPPICSINKFSARGGVFICGRRRETQIRSGEKNKFPFVGFCWRNPLWGIEVAAAAPIPPFLFFAPPPTLVCQIKIKSPDRRKAGAGGEYFLLSSPAAAAAAAEEKSEDTASLRNYRERGEKISGTFWGFFCM